MPDEQPDQFKNLLRLLQHEADELLLKHHVYELLNYGWRGADTPDPEYIGLAMWQVTPPFDHDWAALENRTPTYVPTKRDEILLANGEDFTGAMDFARKSLGMALCLAAVSDQNVLTGNEEFWHEYATTLLWLNIASDRLRDFFLMARFGQTKKKYQNRRDERAAYAYPFKDAIEGASSNLQKCLAELSELAVELQENRAERNRLVHKVATLTARLSIELLREQRRLASKENRPANVSTFRDETFSNAIEAMKEWYRRLVKASSLTFEFECGSRTDNIQRDE
jgi:hypothetical protein